MKQVIITGAPSTGKSTLIQELDVAGHQVYIERARQVIETQQSKNGTALPWIDNHRFSQLVLELQLRDLKRDVGTALSFFDRGIPDVLAYFLFYGQDHLYQAYQSIAKEYRYHSAVYILPPWEDIYNNDAGRKESFEEALQIDVCLRQAYEQLGYNLIQVPFANSKDRLKFILKDLLLYK